MKNYSKGSFRVPFLILMPLVFLVIYYVISVGSLLFVSMGSTSAVGRWFSLISAQDAILHIILSKNNSALLSFDWVSVAIIVHKNNPVLLKELAEYHYNHKNYIEALRLYSKVLDLDAKTMSNYVAYQSAQKKLGQGLDVYKQTEMLSRGFLDIYSYEKIQQGMRQYPPNKARFLLTDEDLFVYPELKVAELIARECYFIGVSLFETGPRGAAYWWTLASNLDSSVSYYFVDLSRLLIQKFYDNNGAREVLRRCTHNVSAKNHCQLIMNDLIKNNEILLPGLFINEVKSILK